MTEGTEEEGLNFDQVVELIKSEVTKIPREQILFTLRKLKVRVLPETVDSMCTIATLEKLGLPITVKLLAKVKGISEDCARSSLHILGDKKCIVLIRGSRAGGAGMPLRWLVSKDFMEAWKGGRTDDESNVGRSRPDALLREGIEGNTGSTT